MPTDTLFDREQSALARLQQLVRDRAAGERAVTEGHVAATAEAEREVQKARRTVGGARKKVLDELETGHQLAAREIASRYDAAHRDVDQKRIELRKKTVDHFSAQLEKTRQQYQDKQWTVDSLLEAGEKEAADTHQELKRKAAASAKRAEAVWAEAAPRLASVRLTRGQVTFDPRRLPVPTVTDPLGKVQKCLEDAEAAAARLDGAFLPKLLGVVPTILMFALSGAIAAGVMIPAGVEMPTAAYLIGGWAVFGGLFLRVLLGVLAKRQVRDRGAALGVYLAETERAIQTLDEYADTSHAAKRRELAEQHADSKRKADEYYQPKIAKLEQDLAETLEKIDTQHAKKSASLREARQADATAEAERFERESAEANAKFDADIAEAEGRYNAKTASLTAARDATWDKLTTDWHNGLADVAATVGDLSSFGAAHFPAWGEVAPVTQVPLGIRYGSLDVDLYGLPDGMPFDPRLNPADPLRSTVPAYLPFPDGCSVLVKAKNEDRTTAVNALQAMMLRFLTGLPPGKVRFTIIDPVGLGENFASFMHLADYDENLVTARIWTEPGHIEKRLADLTEHMENVIQKYLRNQYRSIEDYNRAAGEVAEPYRVLVIANFPANFTPDAAKRLISIMSSGPSCGVCTLVSVDTRAALPRDFRLSDLEQVSLNLACENGKFKLADPALAPFPLTVDLPPAPETIATLVKVIGQASKDAARVEVPFDFIAPPADKVWTSSADKGVEVPIGRAGATRRQVFSLGRGTAQHAVVAGKTGSGKSTLLHAFIANLALMYSPDEVELYLIDFKEGVEFKPYAVHKLPHARVVAIQSEREFGLSVLQRLDGVLHERGDAFRTAEVNDLDDYREWLDKNRPGEKCPRILLIVDEFQQFFIEDDKLSNEAALLLDRLVRQGRAFGVHVLLGSQTLGGAYSLARSTIDQMAVRIALQCSEADAQLILSKDNTAARLLNRPGEAIYNDANGRIEGNDPFQVVWLDEDRREQILAQLHERAAGRSDPMLVFEGSTTADLTKNPKLAQQIAEPAAGPPVAWLGDAIAIKDPTAAVFRPQSSANLLLLGQYEESALALATSVLTSLARRPIAVIDGTPDDSEYADYLRGVADALGLSSAVVNRADIPTVLGELSAELDRRQKGEAERTPRFLLVHGLHRLRELRKPEEDYGFGRKGEKQATPGEQFAALLRDGPPVGLHVVAWCDSLTNLQRALDRQGLKEFALRALFQMSAADSSNLIDSPAASRLGRNRALYVEEGSERPEKFRPYGLPAMSWLRSVGEQLAGTTSGA